METLQQQPAFQLKGNLFTLTVLQLRTVDLNKIKQQLQATIARSPRFFENAPIVIDFQGVNNAQEVSVIQLNQILHDLGVIPVGIRTNNIEVQALAAKIGLSVFPESNQAPKTPPTNPVVAKTPSSKTAPQKEKPTSSRQTTTVSTPLVSNSKIVTTPIRSGQQVYAKGGDLIVLASVGSGAELLADGNIHVYGTLRGRALAGLQGNSEASIFCQKLDAQLVSIAGRYLTQEEMKRPSSKGTIRIFSSDDKIQISLLS